MKNKKLFAILTLVCFMFTLMPVAAFAGDAVADMSYLALTSAKSTINAGDTAKFAFVAKNNAGNDGTLDGKKLFVYAKDENGNLTSAVTFSNNGNPDYGTTAVDYVYERSITQAFNSVGVDATFAREGEYTVYAVLMNGNVTISKMSDLTAPACAADDVIRVLDSSTVAPDYTMAVAGVNPDQNGDLVIGLTPNNITNEYSITFKKSAEVDANGDYINYKEVYGATVAVDTDSANINATLKKATTGVDGVVKLQLSASREGTYTVYLTIGSEEFVIYVNCTNTNAAYIETTEVPDAPIALYETLNEDVVFTVTDINGNAVQNLAVNDGAKGLYDRVNNGAKAQYLHFIAKPATSSLTDGNLGLDAIDNGENGEYALTVNKAFNAEGTYTVRAILDNGSVATATWEVKKFGTPVAIEISSAPATVELGKTFTPVLKYVDENGVKKVAKDVELAVAGYAVKSFGLNAAGQSAKNQVILKTDEKYAGSVITLTAVSERYDLVATKEVKIAAEAVAIEFATDSLEVNVNNKVEWNVVDAEGNNVKLTDVASTEVKYVVLDKPADAKVSVYDKTGSNFDGDGVMALTSDKVGNVAIQAVAKVELKDDTTSTQQTQYKYYTGTQIFAVGTEGVGDVVVMSIGSNEIVKNDEVATMIAAPIVENNRTFVPFRALAEAFGAEVAWDEATQAVTAELNGVTVVMTIGSATYTINGEEATMDVAPFINGSSTMVPVRFAAQAFGIKVIPTYDENGATADILFNL